MIVLREMTEISCSLKSLREKAHFEQLLLGDVIIIIT